MIDLVLQRLSEPDANTTFGEFRHNGSSIGVKTLEKAWVDKNEDGISDKGESRIPAGTYAVVRGVHHPDSPKAYDCPVITGVPGRSDIHVHIANTADQLRGCVATGLEYGKLDGKPAVLSSSAAFSKLMKAYPLPWRLIVRDIA